jgi:hypothetical protein
MPRYADYTDFAQQLVEWLPSPKELEARRSEFWDLLEVNASRILEDAGDADFLEGRFSSLGVGGLQVLCLWAGLEPLQTSAGLQSTIAEYLTANLAHSGCQSVILINEFLYRRRTDTIEALCRLILPEDQYTCTRSSDVSANSKRFCYAILAFVQNPHNLRLLMLHESAERAGYTRYVLVPRTETLSGNPIDKESVNQAQQHIESGADLAVLDIETVDNILDDFERRYGHKESLCFDLFKDPENTMTLVFILRDLRESLIREVDGVVFGNEAELVVLRLYDRMRTIDEHASTGIGVRIANAIASALLEDVNLRYIEDTQLTQQADFESLIGALASGSDEKLRLRELYLETAPIKEAPILILRCDKEHNLSVPLEFLEEKNVHLLQDLHNIRNLKVGFVIPAGEDKQDVYSFTVFCKRLRSMAYFLPYAAANISTDVRSQFEVYLREKFDVRVVPGTT